MKEANEIVEHMRNESLIGNDRINYLDVVNSLIASSMNDLSLIGDDFTYGSAASHIIPILIELNRIDQAKELYKKISIHFIRKELQLTYSILQ